jgi:hypothetical protein
MQRFSLYLSTAILAALVVAGAPPGSLATSAKKQSPSVSSPTLIMTLESGGFGSPGVRRVPLLVATPDRQLYQSVPSTSAYPRPSLESFTLLTLSKADFQTTIKLATTAGLGRKSDYGMPATADVAALTVTFNGTVNTIKSFGVGDDVLPAKQLERRNKLKALIAFLQSRAGGTVSTPTSIVVMPRNAEGFLPTDPSLQQAPRAWPPAAFDLREMGGCKVVSGAEAAAASLP